MVMPTYWPDISGAVDLFGETIATPYFALITVGVAIAITTWIAKRIGAKQAVR